MTATTTTPADFHTDFRYALRDVERAAERIASDLTDDHARSTYSDGLAALARVYRMAALAARAERRCCRADHLAAADNRADELHTAAHKRFA